jgi:hypothetical protein
MESKLKSCNCEGEDVCPKCMDSVIDDFYKDLVEGRLSKETIREAIEYKILLRNMLSNPKGKKMIDNEIELLQSYYEKA